MGSLVGMVTGGGGGGGGVQSGVTDSTSQKTETISGQNSFTIGGINLGTQSAPQVDNTQSALPKIPTTVWYIAAGVAALGLVWYVVRR